MVASLDCEERKNSSQLGQILLVNMKESTIKETLLHQIISLQCLKLKNLVTPVTPQIPVF